MRIVFSIVLVVALIFLGLKFVPVYYGNYAFKDYVEDESRRASYASGTGADTVRDEVFKKAQDLDIPVTKEQIHVDKGGVGAGTGIYPVAINVDYTVHLDLLVTSTDLHFAVASQNRPM
jgi:hypothetical protein